MKKYITVTGEEVTAGQKVFFKNHAGEIEEGVLEAVDEAVSRDECERGVGHPRYYSVQNLDGIYSAVRYVRLKRKEVKG